MTKNKTTEKQQHQDGVATRLMQKLMTTRPSKFIILLVIIASVVAGASTYIAMTQTPEETERVFWLMNIDFGLFLLLSVLVARQITRLWTERRKGLAGSQLHVRLVFIFGILTATPALLMAIFSTLFFYFGVQGWFSDRVSTAVNESLIVAEAYLNEHQQVMRADVLAMANDLNRAALELADNPTAMERFVQTQSQLRNLSEAIVFTSSGRVLARSRLAFTLEFDPIAESELNDARNGEVVLLVSDQSVAQDRVRALVKLDQYFDTFLLVGRLVDSNVVDHLTNARQAVEGYTELEGRQSSFQLTITLVFVSVALLLVLVSIWLGLIFAGQLARPISQLIKASENVRAGDFTTRVLHTDSKDEIGALGQSFNSMTAQLANQREELMHANRLIDERRRFMEAVLDSTSSGILGIDAKHNITIANPAAAKLLGYKNENLLGRDIGSISEDIKSLLEKTGAKIHTHEIEYETPDGIHRIFSLRMTSEGEQVQNIIITFDDVSPLLSAQRKAAWSDVARRIAHEIKNPLTPIQLSAERLVRKYLPQIKDDPDTFKKCTDTIIRQVTQIGHMVKEFSDFARLPEPIKTENNVIEVCTDAVVLQQQAYPKIRFDIDYDKNPILAVCDAGLITQVLNNILQNAVDAIIENQKTGRISVKVKEDQDFVSIVIDDDGPGIPAEALPRVTEPYVTTRKKGTGLGLAIAKKILDDHNGNLDLENKTDDRGTIVTIKFEKKQSR